MKLIFRRGEPDVHGELSDTSLSDLYRHPLPTSGAWLRTNFVTSLDGSIQGSNGRSGGVSTPSDHHVFALHRAHCDAVLVGAGTARTEGYRAVDLAPWQREVRREQGMSDFPLLVVVSASLDLDPAIATASAAGYGAVVVVTSERPPIERVAPLVDAGIEVLRSGGSQMDLRSGGSQVDLRGTVSQLAERGFRRLLCEGGPRLHRDLLAADLVDSLSLTLAPLVVGGAGSRTTSGPALDATPGFELDFALYADDHTLFTQYVRA